MAVTALAAAKRLGELSGWSLSNLELQKILYLAHMVFLDQHNGEPLVHGHFEAWDYGPVHPLLYHHIKIFGASNVENIFYNVEDVPVDSPEDNILQEAFSALGDVGPGQLVKATHQQNGAWDRHYIPGVRNNIIPNEDIQNEYVEMCSDKAE